MIRSRLPFRKLVENQRLFEAEERGQVSWAKVRLAILNVAVTSIEGKTDGESGVFDRRIGAGGREKAKYEGQRFILPRASRLAIIVVVDMEIISAPSFRFPAALALACLLPWLPGNLSTATAAEVTLQKVPALTVEQAPAYPENLARYDLGAQVEAAPEGSPSSALQLNSPAAP